MGVWCSFDKQRLLKSQQISCYYVVFPFLIFSHLSSDVQILPVLNLIIFFKGQEIKLNGKLYQWREKGYNNQFRIHFHAGLVFLYSTDADVFILAISACLNGIYTCMHEV